MCCFLCCNERIFKRENSFTTVVPCSGKVGDFEIYSIWVCTAATRVHFMHINNKKSFYAEPVARFCVRKHRASIQRCRCRAVAKSAILKSTASWSVPLGSKRASSDYEVDQTALQDLWRVSASENTVLPFSGVGAVQWRSRRF